MVDIRALQGRAGQGKVTEIVAGQGKVTEIVAGQGKVTEIVAGQVAGYERHNLSTCNKFHINHYRHLL
jgi:hypothetical protein